MAQVPIDATPDIGLDSSATPRQSVQTSPLMFGGGLASGLEDVGKSLTQRSDVLAQHAVAFQQLDNKAASDKAFTDLLNKNSDLLYNPNGGYYTQKGQDAITNYQPVHDQLMANRDAISAALPNDASRLLFDADSRRMVSYTTMDAAKYAAEQRNSYLLSTSKGLQQTLANSASLNYNDDKAFNASLSGIHDEVEHQGMLTGASIAEVNAQQQKETSNAWRDRVLRYADNDPIAASRLYNANQDKFSAGDQVYLDHLFKTTLAPIYGHNIAQSIMQGNYAVADIGKMSDALTATEKTPAGVTSSTGAMGVMQVEPATAIQMAKELGVPYDPVKMNGTDADSIAYQKAIGVQYVKDNAKEFNGNPALIASAYNAGPGATRQFIAKYGDPSKGEVSTQDFVSQLPNGVNAQGVYIAKNDVRKYVTQALTNYGGVAPGSPATSQDPKAHLADWMSQADTAAGYAEPGEPLFANTIKASITAATNQVVTAQTAARNTAHNNLLTATMGGENANGPKPTTVPELMNSYSGAKNDWAAASPEQRQQLLGSLQRNAKGTPVAWNDSNLSAYHGYLGMYNSDPEKFQSIDFAHVDNLPDSARKELIQKQTGLTNKPADNQNVLRAISLARTAGFNTNKNDNPDQYNQFVGGLSKELDEFQEVHGRRPNDSDIRNITQRMLMPQPGTAGFLGFGGKQKYQMPFSDVIIGGVPDDDAAKIVQSYKANFGKTPTEGQIQWWYQQGQAHGGR